jgi:hypothetical protein
MEGDGKFSFSIDKARMRRAVETIGGVALMLVACSFLGALIATRFARSPIMMQSSPWGQCHGCGGRLHLGGFDLRQLPTGGKAYYGILVCPNRHIWKFIQAPPPAKRQATPDDLAPPPPVGVPQPPRKE